MAKPAVVDLSGYVNVHGRPITLTESHIRRAMPKRAAAQLPADASPTGKHMGWHAVGFSPEQLTKARAAKGAEMLARAGWKRVAVVEVIKK